MKLSASVASILALAIAGSCGGGGGGGSSDRTTVLSVDGATWDGTLWVAPGALLRWNTIVIVGDDPDAIQMGYVGFALGGVPAGATIRSARLRLYHGETAGTPYAKLGAIYADHLDVAAPDRVMPTGDELQSLMGPLSEDAAEGWRELDVGDNLRADLLAGRTRSVFRLRFWQPVPVFIDAFVDRMVFENHENPSGEASHRPVLVVTWTP